MTYSKTISASKKAKATVFLVQKYGDVCWYCKMPFVQQLKPLSRTIDHINNNEDDNRFENLLLAHLECNEHKKVNADWQILALEQLAANNADAEFHKIKGDRESERENNADAHPDELTDGELNRIINRTVDTYLTDKLPKDDTKRLPFTDTLNVVTYLVMKETNGRGSQQAVRRALEVRCCTITEFDVIRESGKRYIVRKEGQ